jgi:hypothetical protein
MKKSRMGINGLEIWEIVVANYVQKYYTNEEDIP